MAQCGHEGTFIEFQAHRDRVSLEPRAQGLDPRLNGFRGVCEAQERTPCSARCLSAAIGCGIRPIEADKSGQGFGRSCA